MAVPARSAAPGCHARLSVRDAVVLGLIQGPTEVLPVSSSGHLVLVPALLGWSYAELPADVRKTFEVALHVGAGAALAWLLRDDVAWAARHPLTTAALTGPAALAALAFEDRIETRASNPKVAAVAMAVGGFLLGWADRNALPKRGACHLSQMKVTAVKGDRHRVVLVGFSQALALVPGVSRNGITLTAARALGMGRDDAARLSWRAGLPVIGGAAALKVVRLRQRGLDPALRAPFAAGALAAFASTLAVSPLLRVRRQRLTAAYRIAAGALALRRLHRLEWPRD